MRGLASIELAIAMIAIILLVGIIATSISQLAIHTTRLEASYLNISISNTVLEQSICANESVSGWWVEHN